MKSLFYLALFIVSIIAIALVPKAGELLSLRPNAGLLQQYQLWRWLSGHMVHASWMHLSLNILSLVLLRIIFIHWLSNTTWLLLMLSSALTISAGLILTSPLETYLGFSGIFYSLLIYCLLQQWPSQKIGYSLALSLVIGKISYEHIVGPSESLEDLIGISIASAAHAWGALAGGLFWCLQQWINSSQQR